MYYFGCSVKQMSHFYLSILFFYYFIFNFKMLDFYRIIFIYIELIQFCSKFSLNTYDILMMVTTFDVVLPCAPAEF